MIEKLPRDLPLYAGYVLRILSLVLGSKDITVVEETLPTFEKFCAHQDVAALAADQTHITQYENIVRTYADFALQYPSSSKGSISNSVALRWRSAGLQALQSVTSSEAVGADGGTQLNIIMPMILHNLHPENEEYIAILQQRSEEDQTEDKESARRRMSIATVRTTETAQEPVSGSADDADRLAEEEVALQAWKCLRRIFTTSNRAQIRMATAAILRFVYNPDIHQKNESNKSTRFRSSRNWATTVIELVSRWTPMQDRFVILVTIVETIVRSPVAEENLEQQLVLTTMVGWLLRSDINMIGLSVMDVLLGLIQHILLLLQLGGKALNVLPHHQQTDAIDLFSDKSNVLDRPASSSSAEKLAPTTESLSPSTNRVELLNKLQRCIGALATHVYYSDQISDMIAAILLRLRPSPSSGLNTATAAIETQDLVARAFSDSAKLQENPDTDDFFSFGTARVAALKAIKEILTVANKNTSAGNAGAVGRNRVAVQVWEGTQWLLRDDDRRVRRAYVDALLTWLGLEMGKKDLLVMEDKRKVFRASTKKYDEGGGLGHLTRRIGTIISQRERSIKSPSSTFLQLLHLAIYENAINSSDSEADLLLLHLLMVNLVNKLGVNAAKTGIPMVVKLQEDMKVGQIVSTSSGRVNIGSFVYGYFWALSEKFDFDASRVGFEIQEEISRRRRLGLWLHAVQLPPVPLEQIISASTRPPNAPLSPQVLTIEELKPFESFPAMIEQIAAAYAFSVTSPPNSPPNSPGRVFSMPILSKAETPKPESPDTELPSTIKAAMLAEWSKEICIANIEETIARPVSFNGSRTGTNLSAPHRHLTINGRSPRHGSPNGAHSPNRTSPLSQNGNNLDTSPNHGPQSTPFDPLHIRHSTAHGSSSPTPISSSDQNHILRIDDLKRILAGGSHVDHTRGASPLRNTTARRDFVGSSDNHSTSTGSESAISFESASEGTSLRSAPPMPTNASISSRRNPPVSYNTVSAAAINRQPTSRPHSLRKDSLEQNRPSRPQSFRRDSLDQSRNSRPHSLRQDSSEQTRLPTRSSLRPSSSSSAAEDPAANAKALRGDFVAALPSATGKSIDDDVPPVPPLPANVAVKRNLGGLGSGETRPVSRGFGADRATLTTIEHSSKKRGVDVVALLNSIDTTMAGKGKSIGHPPY